MAGMQRLVFSDTGSITISWVRTKEVSVMERKMFTRFNNRFGRAFAQLGSAVRVSAAVRAGQKPAAQDLETLGIDVDQFRRIQG